MIGTVLLLGFTLGLNNFRTARLDRASAGWSREALGLIG